MSTGASDDVITSEDAAEILGVGPEQVSAMVDQGLLTSTETADGDVGFTRADVEAVRLQGS